MCPDGHNTPGERSTTVPLDKLRSVHSFWYKSPTHIHARRRLVRLSFLSENAGIHRDGHSHARDYDRSVDGDLGDPRAYGGVVASIMIIAMVAAWLPARRAARIDPLITMRPE